VTADEVLEVPEVVVFDVDGVFTDGAFLYSESGKAYKRFGPDDADAVALLRNFVEIVTVSADRRGEAISRARIERDMGLPLFMVSAPDRLSWLSERWELPKVVYMGDSFLDAPVLLSVGYGIAPANADQRAKEAANFVTSARGAERAVAEACMHLMQLFNFDWNVRS
jgi:3-deoxy-D-manno-octulosonate 8-phosphate phosphatase (KDO 8-P phosphatase)